MCDSLFGDGQLGRLLHELRGRGTTAPTIALATTGSPLSRGVARLCGADAYVALDEGSPELLARVRALLEGARPWPLSERAAELGTKVRPATSREMRLWDLYCPQCATLLEAEICDAGEPSGHDIRLGVVSDAEGEPF